ncbi:hypothetical protein KEM56_002125 [Ascosphaera pollenicola]|nr:hypothetical protein KEM56_002125 [Ascosphaera pollenicola]
MEDLPVAPESLDQLDRHYQLIMLRTIANMVALLEPALPALPSGLSPVSNRLREAKYEDLNANHLHALLNAILEHSDANPNDQAILDAAYKAVGNGVEKKSTISELHDGTAAVAASAFWQKDRTSVPDSASAFLLQKLQAYHHAYILHPPSYVAPYAAIVGPSGIGKSFIIKELAVTHEQYVVYVNLSNPESSADTIQNLSTLDSDVCATAWTNLIKCLCLDARANYDANVSPHDFFHTQATNRICTRNLTSDLPHGLA